MARKNHQFKVVRPSEQIAAMNMLSAINHLSILRLPPRLKKPAPPRRRIPVVIFAGSPEPVKIRHVRQDLGSPASEVIQVSEFQTSHSPRP